MDLLGGVGGTHSEGARLGLGWAWGAAFCYITITALGSEDDHLGSHSESTGVEGQMLGAISPWRRGACPGMGGSPSPGRNLGAENRR